MALKDTLEDKLQNLKQDAERDKQSELDRPKLIAEWQQAVNWLFARVREWLTAYEQNGLLSFSEQEIPITEEATGPYRIRMMELHAGKATIVLRPVGRFIIGATGRVDMHVLGRMIETERVMFLRTTRFGATEEEWGILIPERAGSLGRGRRVGNLPNWSRRNLQRLTQENLKEAVERLLG